MTKIIGDRIIKESFDNLPSGICFADRHGVIILCNHQMHRLCYQLMGSDLQHIFELRNALSNPKPGVSYIDRSGWILHFPDGEVWGFRESTVTDRFGEPYAQMQASNLTELYKKRAELEKENLRLQQVNERAKRLYIQLDQTIREEETFAAKRNIHDRIGLHLLSTRQALTRESTLPQLQELGKMWKNEIESLPFVQMPCQAVPVSAKQPRTATKALHEFIDSAAGIGVNVIMSGSLPRDDEKAYLLITAMRECATNTIRHAMGSKMKVLLRETKDTVLLEITNNGRQPRQEIVEGGGLSELRRRIEQISGTMQIKSRPVYRLTVILPRKEDLQ